MAKDFQSSPESMKSMVLILERIVLGLIERQMETSLLQAKQWNAEKFIFEGEVLLRPWSVCWSLIRHVKKKRKYAKQHSVSMVVLCNLISLSFFLLIQITFGNR